MYDFVTHTWNAIKGACPHDCSYCYMKRWGEQKPVRFDESELKTDLGSGNFIFVGSSCDMFADKLPISWIERTIEHLKKFDNQYFFQTKDPGRFNVWMSHYPPKSHICTTIETNRRYEEMGKAPTPYQRSAGMRAIHDFFSKSYVTIEPIMDFDYYEMIKLIRRCSPAQVNIGADSGGNKLTEPSKDQILELIDGLSKFTIVKQKKNLKRLLV